MVIPQNDSVYLRQLTKVFKELRSGPGDRPVASGGNLCPEMLMAAYLTGVFPWYNQDTPILWWAPDPRCVLVPGEFTMSARSRRKIKHGGFMYSVDCAFEDVIKHCAHRPGGEATWLCPAMIEAYINLHKAGLAHSVETWHDGVLVGGLYGVAMGGIFSGESMFHLMSEASRGALAMLIKILLNLNFELVDCQMNTPHFMRMGAKMICRKEYNKLVDLNCQKCDLVAHQGSWKEYGKNICLDAKQ